MNKVKRIVALIYNYTHLFVGAGAVVTSFLDTQQLPPKWAAGVVLVSQGLKVASTYLTEAKVAAPVVEKVADAVIGQAKSVLPPVAALSPAAPKIETVATGTVGSPTTPSAA